MNKRAKNQIPPIRPILPPAEPIPRPPRPPKPKKPTRAALRRAAKDLLVSIFDNSPESVWEDVWNRHGKQDGYVVYSHAYSIIRKLRRTEEKK